MWVSSAAEAVQPPPHARASLGIAASVTCCTAAAVEQRCLPSTPCSCLGRVVAAGSAARTARFETDSGYHLERFAGAPSTEVLSFAPKRVVDLPGERDRLQRPIL
ncbi:MAG TPA: hypothetical protein VKB72_11295 [Steroidobacteraceae bacterium]|nr:hypothetical protein [Steroidobacteraceae bacterium]